MSILDRLHRDVLKCRLCEAELEHGVRPVLQLSSESRILIAGQAPGRRVHESGVPFDDPSGERLREWMGVDRTTFYDRRRIAILPMGFCYPGSTSSGDRPPRRECAPAWRQPLLDQLSAVQFILVVGAYAMRWHLGPAQAKRGVTRVVREWRAHWPNTLPMPHPSPRNHSWLSKNPWFESDVVPVLRTRVREILEPPPRSTESSAVS